MRTEVRFILYYDSIPGRLRAVLEATGCGPDEVTEDKDSLNRQYVTIKLDEKDPRLPAVREFWTRHRGWIEFYEDHYTEEELQNARLIVMVPNESCKIDGGIEWGTTYDRSSACRSCATGIRQTSAMLVDGEQLSALEGHRAGATAHFQPLVDDGLAAELERTGATGLSFHSVRAAMPDDSEVVLPWKQLCAARTLPAMLANDGLRRVGGCRACRKKWYSKYFWKPLRFVYRASDLRGADDVNLSLEHKGFGRLSNHSHDMIPPAPWFLVTPKVRRIFLDAGVTEFDWLPIRVED